MCIFIEDNSHLHSTRYFDFDWYTSHTRRFKVEYRVMKHNVPTKDFDWYKSQARSFKFDFIHGREFSFAFYKWFWLIHATNQKLYDWAYSCKTIFYYILRKILKIQVTKCFKLKYIHGKNSPSEFLKDFDWYRSKERNFKLKYIPVKQFSFAFYKKHWLKHVTVKNH